MSFFAFLIAMKSTNLMAITTVTCWAWFSFVGRLTVLTLLVVEGLELQSTSHHPALLLVAAPVFFLCLPCFSQSELRGGKEVQQIKCLKQIYTLQINPMIGTSPVGLRMPGHRPLRFRLAALFGG
eukprot:1149759-Pelagomonas_calceolata.AAC.6